MFKRVSIKYKLLVALILLPLSGLSIYTYYAVNLIKEDKLAYVMNATNSSARNLTTSLLLTMESHRALNELVLNEYINQKNKDDFLEKLKEKNIVLVSSFSGDKDKEKGFSKDRDRSYIASTYQKDFENRSLDSEFLDFLKTYSNESNEFRLFKVLPELQANIYFTFDKELNQAFFSIILAETFFNQLAKNDFYTKFIKVNDQISKWGEGDSKLISDFFELNKELEFSKTSEEGKNIISLAPNLGKGRVRILTLASKDYVYGPIYLLTEKTIIFFLLLLGISLSISILISDRLS